MESHVNMWDEAKNLFSIPDDIIPPSVGDGGGDCWRYTREYITYDFEAVLLRESVRDLEYSSSSEVLVYGDDGRPCTEREYMEEHNDDRIILVNRPLSFAIACNFYDSE